MSWSNMFGAMAASILLLLSPLAMAARVPTEALEEGGWMPFAGDVDALRAMIFGRKEHLSQERERSVVAFKFIVPPGEGEDFVEAWKNVETQTTQEKGNLLFDLKKTELDNFMFMEYGEWERKQDFMDHFESSYIQDFADHCAERGIIWMMKLLKPIVDDPDTPQSKRMHNTMATKGMTHVLFRYFVPADKHENFMSMFEDTAKETWKESGNRVYCLRKSMTDNLEFYGYGTWETLDDYLEHFTSDHIYQLRQFARENGIVWMASPLYKIGEEPEALF